MPTVFIRCYSLSIPVARASMSQTADDSLVTSFRMFQKVLVSLDFSSLEKTQDSTAT